MLICTAIKTSNPTWAGIIEISYPLFIAAVSWLAFNEHHINKPVVIGAALIFCGVFFMGVFSKDPVPPKPEVEKPLQYATLLQNPKPIITESRPN